MRKLRRVSGRQDEGDVMSYLPFYLPARLPAQVYRGRVRWKVNVCYRMLTRAVCVGYFTTGHRMTTEELEAVQGRLWEE